MKRKLTFILAFMLILPCIMLMSACTTTVHTHEPCSVCGLCTDKNCTGDENEKCTCSAHEHSWESTWSYNATEHYHKCTADGCTEKSEKANHDVVNNVCTVCEYVSDNVTPVTTTVRDLKVYTYQTTNAGVFTFVELPDGKNMLIDSGTSIKADNYKLEDALFDSTYALRQIDYLVLTNTTSYRCGGIKYLENNFGSDFKVVNFYYPDTTGATFSISDDFTNAVTALQGKSGCEQHVVTDDSDITALFKDATNATHTYKIDFMTPLAVSECTSEYDNQIFISIEYKNKTILLTGDATERNIGDSRVTPNGGYINKYEKDVDVLITGYVYSSLYAITNSGARNNKSFIEDISLENGDKVIITVNEGTTEIGALKSQFISSGATIYPFNSTVITTTISHTNGAITVG